LLFTGLSNHAIDAKLRLAIPAKYRNQWDAARDGAAWYCIPWPTGHLRLYTEMRFRDLAERREQTLTPGRDEAELEKVLFGFAERIEMDSAGRIVVPKQHIELAKIGMEVVIVGAGSRLEVHDRPAWEASQNDLFNRLPELIDAARGSAGGKK
jgi:MraZ protein